MQPCAHGPRTQSASGPRIGRSARRTPAKPPGWCRTWASGRSGWAGRPGSRPCGRCSRRPTAWWSRPASSTCGATTRRELAAEYAQLAEDFPDRVLVGHRHRPSRRPRASTPRRWPRCVHSSTAWTGRHAAAARPPLPGGARPEDARALRRALARSHTRTSSRSRTPVPRARSSGADALLAPELACVVDSDVDSASAKARRYAELYLGLRNYTSNLLRHGFSRGRHRRRRL